MNYSLWAVKRVIGLYDCGLRTGRGQTDVKKGHYAVKSGLMNPFPVRRQWRRNGVWAMGVRTYTRTYKFAPISVNFMDLIMHGVFFGVFLIIFKIWKIHIICISLFITEYRMLGVITIVFIINVTAILGWKTNINCRP